MIDPALREEFETLVVSYVLHIAAQELSLSDMVERRGNDGNYFQHSLTHSMWIGFLLAHFDQEDVFRHLGFVTVH